MTWLRRLVFQALALDRRAVRILLDSWGETRIACRKSVPNPSVGDPRRGGLCRSAVPAPLRGDHAEQR